MTFLKFLKQFLHKENLSSFFSIVLLSNIWIYNRCRLRRSHRLHQSCRFDGSKQLKYTENIKKY